MEISKYIRILFLFLLPIALVAEEKMRICLNMIVKNETHVIERALSSVKGLIDYWVIVDTGSFDGTQQLIQKAMAGIPGELYERPWKNFGINRTEALELARGKADYILFLDADDWLAYGPSFVVPTLNADIYWAKWQSSHVSTFSYLKPLMVKDSLPCRWEGVVHEYITYDQAHSQLIWDDVTYVFTSEGFRSKNPKKYEEAARILEEALQAEPHNARYMFYLGESYRDAGHKEQALAAYQKRAKMGDWQEEVFWSLLQIGHMQKDLGYPYENVLSSYLDAHQYNPYRSEPIYYLAELYNENGRHALAYECIHNWLLQPKVEQQNLLFRLGWIDDYGLTFQHSISTYYVNKYQESLDLNDLLLMNPELPETVRNQVLFNRKFPLHKCSESK